MKPVVYAPIPADFDQTTHYIVQLQPVEHDDHIFVGIEMLPLPPQEDRESEMMRSV